jgi:hypothetical protein
MKKIILGAVVLSLLISVPVFAEEEKKEEMPRMGKMGCPMMAKTQMVSTDEGGVIVLAGNKLLKYDADLDLVKEVEVPVPAVDKQCPMMGKMMKKDSAPAAVESQEKKV